MSDKTHKIQIDIWNKYKNETKESLLEIISNQDKEIERLQHNQEVSTKWEIKLTKKNTKLKEENKRLKSIINEVREYIEELAEDTEDYIGAIDRRRKEELLAILDKAGSETNGS